MDKGYGTSGDSTPSKTDSDQTDNTPVFESAADLSAQPVAENASPDAENASGR